MKSGAPGHRGDNGTLDLGFRVITRVHLGLLQRSTRTTQTGVFKQHSGDTRAPQA